MSLELKGKQDTIPFTWKSIGDDKLEIRSPMSIGEKPSQIVILEDAIIFQNKPDEQEDSATLTRPAS